MFGGLPPHSLLSVYFLVNWSIGNTCLIIVVDSLIESTTFGEVHVFEALDSINPPGRLGTPDLCKWILARGRNKIGTRFAHLLVELAGCLDVIEALAVFPATTFGR